eukprot:1161751-Pelagomonas_calceolata.AAC.3
MHTGCSAKAISSGSRSLQALLLEKAFLLWRANHPEAIQAVSARQQSLERTHLGPPALWFPLARAIERNRPSAAGCLDLSMFCWNLHAALAAGPTNSGKTYSAMQALSAAQSGVYCGPLRLLAVEVHEKLNEPAHNVALIMVHVMRTIMRYMQKEGQATSNRR